MSKWIASELHSHTQHSDGRFTILELAETAKQVGLECVAITDHNTMIPQNEMNRAMKETGIRIINGLEWTTFYGHMVVLGMSNYVDWRNIGIKDIHKGIAKVHEAGGIAGIAHPYRVGSPLCTGCFWQYEVSDWNDVDYLEVWSEFFPAVQECNHRAFSLWTELLNKGYKITGTYGLDWHAPYSEESIVAASFLQMDDSLDMNFEEQAVQAIKNGKVSVSMGPLLLLSVKNKETMEEWDIGEEIHDAGNQSLDFKISIDYSVRKDRWTLDDEPLQLILQSNQGIIQEQEVSLGVEDITQPIHTKDLSWVRAELYGYMNGIKSMIAFTNPIYFSNK